MLAEKCKNKCKTIKVTQKTTATQTRHEETFTQCNEHGPDVVEVEAWTVVFPSPNEKVILLGQRPYTGHSHVMGVPCIMAEKRHITEDQELNTLEEMPGRKAKISAPAQGEQ